MKEMLKYLKPYWAWILAGMTAITVSTVCDLLLPSIMSDILNRGVRDSSFAYIVQCCVKMLVVALVGLAAGVASFAISGHVVTSFCFDLRTAVFHKVHSMSFEEFGKMGTAALVTRATHDVVTVSWLASEISGTVIAIPILFIGGVAMAMSKNVMLSLALLIFVPAIVVFVLLVSKKVRPLREKCDAYIDRQNDIMRERLRGIRVIRAFNSEPREHARIQEATAVMSDTIIRSNNATEMIAPMASFLLNVATLLIVYISGWQIETGSGLTGADAFAVIQYVGLVSSAVVMASFTIVMLPAIQIASKRIGQVLDSTTLADPIARQDTVLSGDIQMDHVTFCYEGAQEPAVKDISLHIKPGQKVAVIGGTGSGKSTLVALLLGLRLPTQGQILMDGIPTTRISRHTLRRSISCVLQNATIYSGTVRENVKMGKLDATDAEIERALTIAQAREFVDSYADGVDHEIKQSGKNLSGGQKQRLSIARAVIKEASIYLFDDSFSALDFLTEAKLRSALNREMAGKNQIVITQRVTSAMHSDCIYVLDKGCLVGAGTHEELMEHCSVYREIYASQTGGEAK